MSEIIVYGCISVTSLFRTADLNGCEDLGKEYILFEGNLKAT